MATAKNALTVFSLSPLLLPAKLLSEKEKNVAFASVAIALLIIVFPVPEGPKSKRPCLKFRQSISPKELQIPLKDFWRL